MRVDRALVLSLALFAGSYTATSPGLVSGVVAASLALLCLERKLTARAAAVIALAFTFAAVRAQRSLAEFEAERAAMNLWLGAPKRCAIEARVTSSPQSFGDGLAFFALAQRVDCEGKELEEGVPLRLYGGPEQLGRGDEFRAVVSLSALQIFNNRELSDARPRLAAAGALLSGSVLSLDIGTRAGTLAHAVDSARAAVRGRIAATFRPSAVGLAQALVLGDSSIDEADGQAYRDSGLAHLLAVSGTHLVLAVLSIIQALNFVLVRIQQLALRCEVARLTAGAGAVLAPLYADFAGGSGSAWRAALMLSASLLVKASGRHPLTSRALAFTLAIGAASDPLIGYDLSFLLSLAATVGLVALGPKFRRILARPDFPVLRKLQEATLATIVCLLPCLPLLLLLSPTINLATVGANLIAGPLGEMVALPVCLLHTVSFAWPALERGAAAVASGALLSMNRVAHATASIHWLEVSFPPPNAAQLGLLLVLSLAVCLRLLASPPATVRECGVRRLTLASAFACALLVAASEVRSRVTGSPKGLLRVTALDVGQGDATLIDLPSGGLMLVDAGGIPSSHTDPGEAIILPLLRARRRDRLDVVVLSHPHPDHFLGLIAVVKAVEIGEFWDTGQGQAEGAGPAYAELIATLRARSVSIKGPLELCGTRHLQGATLDVLAPCPSYVPERAANDNSFVLRLNYGKHRVLLMGDAEHELESELLRSSRTQLAADLLKVGHHGSRTSSGEAFLAAVAPELATVSCGVRNRFGHPHVEALQALARQGVLVQRLDQVGSVSWQTDGNLMSYTRELGW